MQAKTILQALFRLHRIHRGTHIPNEYSADIEQAHRSAEYYAQGGDLGKLD